MRAVINIWFNFWVNVVAASPALPRRLRPAVLRRAGVDVHPSARIRPGLMFGITRDVHIGEKAFINARCTIDGEGSLRIEKNVWIGVDVAFLTTHHELGGPEERVGNTIHLPVVVGAGAWIGAKAAIFPGVTIGPGAVVGAGAVVRDDVEPNTVVAGVPARVVRVLSTSERSSERSQGCPNVVK